jgi:hypothetical protein
MRTSARPYLFMVVATVVLAKYAAYLRQYVWPQIPLIKSHSPGIYVAAFGVLLAGILWLIYGGKRTASTRLQWFFALLIVAWCVQLGLAILHEDMFAISVFLYVPVVFGLWMKTPNALDFESGLRFLGWLVVAILVVTRTLEMLGWIPMVDVGKDLVAFEQANYWLPLSGSLGPPGRWPGPGGHNAMTGNSGAMLVILAAGLKGRSRYVFGLVGVLTLLLTSSRNSIMAVLVGVALIIMTGDNLLTRRFGRKVVIGAFLGLVALAVGYVLLLNRSLTGRTTYWDLFIDLWKQSPLVGVGQTGISAADATIAGTNGHNLIIDSLVRYGILGVVAVVAFLVLAVVITVGASRRRLCLPLGIVGAFLTIGLVESDMSWIGLSELWLWLVLAVGLAAQSQMNQGFQMESRQRGA